MLNNRTIPPCFNHQNESKTFFKRVKRGCDFSDPGTGKTRVQIEDFVSRRKKRGKCALVIATRSLLEPAWKDDFHKFAPGIKCSVAYAANRAKAFEVDADVYIINHDGVKWLAEKPKSFFAKFDTLIIDESTAFKHQTSARSKAAAKIAQYFEYRRVMTGTPTSNGICDIWHQVFIVDDGQRLGKSFFKFRAAACVPTQVGRNANAIQWEDREGIEDVVAHLISDITIRHKFEDCVDIPENHKYAMVYPLSKKARSAYDDMLNHQIALFRKSSVTAVNAGVAAGKLLQISSGAVYDDNEDYTVICKERYEFVVDVAEEREHAVIFYLWDHQRDLIVEELTKRGLSFCLYGGSDAARAQMVRDYQAGKYRYFLAHPQSAGHGLTLTLATASIWPSPTPNLEHWLQGLKRVHRIGQTKRTETICVCGEDTRDLLMWDMLQNKNVKMTNFFEGLL